MGTEGSTGLVDAVAADLVDVVLGQAEFLHDLVHGRHLRRPDVALPERRAEVFEQRALGRGLGERGRCHFLDIEQRAEAPGAMRLEPGGDDPDLLRLGGRAGVGGLGRNAKDLVGRVEHDLYSLRLLDGPKARTSQRSIPWSF